MGDFSMPVLSSQRRLVGLLGGSVIWPDTKFTSKLVRNRFLGPCMTYWSWLQRVGSRNSISNIVILMQPVWPSNTSQWNLKQGWQPGHLSDLQASDGIIKDSLHFILSSHGPSILSGDSRGKQDLASVASTTLSRINRESFTDQPIPSFPHSHFIHTYSFMHLFTLHSRTIFFIHSFSFSLAFTLCVNQNALKNKWHTQWMMWR